MSTACTIEVIYLFKCEKFTIGIVSSDVSNSESNLLRINSDFSSFNFKLAMILLASILYNSLSSHQPPENGKLYYGCQILRLNPLHFQFAQ